MDSGIALVPIDVRGVDFYGEPVIGALVDADDERQVYVPIRPICERLGIDWSGQYQRIKRDDVLNAALRTVRIERSESVGVTHTKSRRGDPNSLCLPLKLLPGFLFGVSTDRIKNKNIRERVVLFRRECYDVLWDAFKHDILPIAALAPTPQTGGAALAYEIATAVQSLARSQMEQEQRLSSVEQSQDRARHWAKSIDGRVAALELRLSPEQPISEAQAAEIALAVKAVAHALQEKGQSNGYQRVYGEMYRRYGIGTYRALPQGQFNKAILWLKTWHAELGDSAAQK
jgi:hypothetical protein